MRGTRARRMTRLSTRLSATSRLTSRLAPVARIDLAAVPPVQSPYCRVLSNLAYTGRERSTTVVPHQPIWRNGMHELVRDSAMSLARFETTHSGATSRPDREQRQDALEARSAHREREAQQVARRETCKCVRAGSAVLRRCEPLGRRDVPEAPCGAWGRCSRGQTGMPPGRFLAS